MKTTHPRVGLGVIVQNADGKILVLRRAGPHAPYYSIPGGSLEAGETFEQGAARELQEECGISIAAPAVIALTNNLETYAQEGTHFVSVILLVTSYTGTPTLLEPDKHAELAWVDPRHLPEPHFEASRQGVECYLSKTFYRP